MTTAPARGIMLSIYLSIYVSFTPRLSHPGSRDLCMSWNAPYTSILMCSRAWFTTACTQMNNSRDYSCLPWRLSMKTTWWVNAQTRGINGFSLLRQCSCPATSQHTCVKQKRPMSLLYCCFVVFISTKARHWTYYSACMLFMDVEPYRLTVLRHHWHCCICSYCHNIISSGLPALVIIMQHHMSACFWSKEDCFQCFQQKIIIKSVLLLECCICYTWTASGYTGLVLHHVFYTCTTCNTTCGVTCCTCTCDMWWCMLLSDSKIVICNSVPRHSC